MKIRVLSKSTIRRIFANAEACSELISRASFISINNGANAGDDDDSMLCPIPEEFRKTHPVLILNFDDSIPEESHCSPPARRPFTRDDAVRIKAFAEEAAVRRDALIIHCQAGISRSGAVGVTLNDYFNRFLEDNPEDWLWFFECGCENALSPNPHVRAILLKVLGLQGF